MSSQQSKVVGLIFGGASGEHDVSIRSAATVAEGLSSGANKERYRVQHVYIDRQGRWWGDATARQVLSSGQALADDGSRPGFSGFPDGCLEVEIWYPVLHGPNGEDGTIQGLFSLMQRPFVGSGVLGSAVGMDKLAMKAAFSAAGLPQGPYRPVLASELGSNNQLLDELEAQLGYPCFIKPANLGSSVGISKATNRSELQAGLELAASHDSRLLVEQGLNVRELECAVLGGQQLKASVLGEVSFDADWYDYETKYSSGLSSTQIPADLPEAISSRAQRLAIEAVQAVGASGLSRVDFFYEEASGSLLINEINTLPGFTSQSMYPMLWKASGVPLEELVHQLLELAQ
ncbi:MAG: D-alanine--D-alanine ligase family protein [Synechococcus sp.]